MNVLALLLVSILSLPVFASGIDLFSNHATINGFKLKHRFLSNKNGVYNSGVDLHGTNDGLRTVVYLRDTNTKNIPSEYLDSHRKWKKLVKNTTIGHYMNIKVDCTTLPDFVNGSGAPNSQQSITFKLHSSSNGDCKLISVQEFSGADSIGPVTDSDTSTNEVIQFADTGDTVGMTALAVDNGDTVSYSLSEDANGRFLIGSTSGVVTVADGSLLEQSVNSSHNITVLATSSDSSTSNNTFSITVLNSSSGCQVVAGETSTATYTIEWDQLNYAGLAGFKIYYGSNEALRKDNAIGSFEVSGDVASSNFSPNEHGFLTCDLVYLAVTSTGDRDESLLSNTTLIIVE